MTVTTNLQDIILNARQKDGIDYAEDPSRFNPVLTKSAAITLFSTTFGSYHPAVGTIVELKAIPDTTREDRMLCYVESDVAANNGLFRFDLQSVQAESVPHVVTPDAGSGRWIQMTKGVSKHDALGAIAGDIPPFHLSEDKYDAAAGTDGTPSGTNRFVTSSDPVLPSSDENDALAGSDGTPSGTNLFITQSDPLLPSSSIADALQGTYGTPSDTNRFVTDQDPRIPLQTENDALQGTDGVPSGTNRFVTDSDPRIPLQTENDALQGTDGAPSGTNRFVTDSDPRIPIQAENDALQGTDGVPSNTNRFVTNSDPRVPTQAENDALQGTSGAPSGSNRFVTAADTRLLTQDENDAAQGASGAPSNANRFVTDSDPRLPTTGENDALQGTNGTPSGSNRFVTDSDPRLPTPDENNALLGTNGTSSGTNRFVTNSDPRLPALDENDALQGTSGTPGAANPYVTDNDPRVPLQAENDALQGSYGTPTAGNPYVTTQDTRLPTQNENDALVGSDGAPSASNTYVTDSDPRLLPSADHASRHIDGGADEMDGDKLNITYVPTNYTRNFGTPEVGQIDQLTSHLHGINEAISAAHPVSHMYGYLTEYTSVTQITIKPGEARNDTDTYNIKNTSNILVAITTIGENGLDVAGEANDTIYYIFVIYNPLSGIVKGLLSASPTAPTLPLGFTAKKLIGYVLNGPTGDFQPFYVNGKGPDKEYFYDDVINNDLVWNTDPGSWTLVDASPFIPVGVTYVLFQIHETNDKSPDFIFRRNGSSATYHVRHSGHVASGQIQMVLDGDREFEYMDDGSDGKIGICVAGFKMEL